VRNWCGPPYQLAGARVIDHANRTVGSNPTLSAINSDSQPQSSVDYRQNPQQIETFWAKDRTGDYRQAGDLRPETAFFSKASYFLILV
jgi:hypothetical protein